MIQVEQLRKSYNGARGLDGFSLHVEAGELFGLVGPNGAGKTTLIKLLATVLRPQGGSALIAGHDVFSETRAVRRIVGYMPDVPGLYQDMRVREYLEFFAAAFHLRGAALASAVEKALHRSRLDERRESFVEELSLGLKQRLVLAKTLLHDPKVLLLDEPATGMDPMARIELRRQLQELQRDGVTILISSHILSDLDDICTRVALIGDGRNAADAEGRTVLVLSGAAPVSLICEIEVLGDAVSAADTARAAGAHVLETSGSRLRVEVKGGREQAAMLLRSLTAAGVLVARFDPRGPELEERYRRAFGGNP